MKYRQAYMNRIADWLMTNPNNLELYWKGRVGLYAILKAFEIKENDEVILPAFTCVVVPNAVIYCDAKPVYVDIDSTTLNTTIDKVKSSVTEKTKVIIIQNTFGLSSQVEEIVTFAKENNILTIEDCTHGFGGEYKGRPNGSYCDAAFYSTQWNKPYSTGIGGFAVMNNPNYLIQFKQINTELGKPTKKDHYVLASLIKVRKYLLNDNTYWRALKLYRRLSKSGLVVGSSKGEELSGTKIPQNYFLRSVKTQEKVGIQALRKLQTVLNERKQAGIIYNTFFRNLNKWNYKDEDLMNHSFLNYPVFVKNKEIFKIKAEKAKIRLGDWFLSPIHPVTENFELWKITPNDFPVANEKSKHILNLPTDTNNIRKVLNFLEENQNELL